MQINIVKGKEIEFTQQLLLLKKLINNEPYIQKFIDTIEYDPDKADTLKLEDIFPDVQFMQNIFERINFRTRFNTKNAGKSYEFFSKTDFLRFMQTEHFFHILSIKVLWNILKKMHQPDKKRLDKIDLAQFSLEVAGELEDETQKNMDELLNSPEIREMLLPDFPIASIADSQQLAELPFEIEEDGILVPFLEECDIEEFFMENDIPLYLNNNDHILRISRVYKGYRLDYSAIIPDNQKIITCKDLHFKYGLFISIYVTPDMPYLEIPHQHLKLYRVPEGNCIPERAQSFYSTASQLLDTLNPLSCEPKEVKKAENTFISIIHHMVKSVFSEKRTSQHLILTISGLIALDIGIIKLDHDYLPNENMGAENERFRKIVSWAIKSKNKLKLNY